VIGRVLASRRFTAADQAAFAEFSGDWNPMHLDPVAARRTQAGDVVVHGVHGALWAMEQIAAAGAMAAPVAAVQAHFHKFIYLDHQVELHVVGQTQDFLQAQLVVDGMVATGLTVTFGAPRAAAANDLAGARETVLRRTPLAPAPADMGGLEGWLAPAAGAVAVAQHFRALCRRLGEARVVALAQCSTAVGMACPGLNSIFSSLAAEMTPDEAGRPGLGWRAQVPDPRYARVTLSVAGAGVRGELKTLVRPAPVEAPAALELSGLVTPREFAGRRAVVIGGSRGLGAVTAKLLAAGGAKVVLTYAVGKAEAEAVVTDIRAGHGAATALRCDVLEDFAGLADALQEATHLYYFATPRITRQSAGVFSADDFAEFNRVYVERFHALCLAAEPAERDLDVLYPSSVAVEDRPRGMTEYAMSKAAGEILCRDLTRAFPRLSITAPRLPRILTDQTAIALPVKAQSAVDVMAPLLRAQRPAGAISG
jgi:NAD(P)-dependent dehydrogenase (short-subunit alcohol dehydrogenase family)/acyl dehydratase